jgi:allophanate hydrolase subunit 1/allophanate hydrolase subunit 2
MTPYGDRALRFELASDAPRRALLERLGALAGVADVVLAETLGCLVLAPGASPSAVAVAAERALATTSGDGRKDARSAARVVDVVYDGEDLAEVARTVGRTPADVVRLHTEPEYGVVMLGFLPGFAYLHGLPEELSLPRRAPRPRVPAGSVAIAAGYSGIYPSASSGGWHLLGRAVGFSPFHEGRPTLAVGDRVRFTPAAADAAGAPSPPPPPSPPAGPHLEVAKIAGLALFVDGGRPGRLRDGIPPGGPLVPSALARANHLAGNAGDACAIELTGAIELVAREGRLVVADGARRIELAPGERFATESGPRTRVAYVAVAGGVDAPVVLGGRGALLSAGIGRPLGRGDRLGVADAPAATSTLEAQAPPPDDGPIELVPGPDVVPGFSLAEVARAPLRISPASSRAGTRLEGYVPPEAAMAAMARPSAPMIEGAIELTPSGLVVLGPDHPTTGGYPVVAVVAAVSRELFFSRPLGAAVKVHLR